MIAIVSYSSFHQKPRKQFFQFYMFAVSRLSYCWCKHDARVSDGVVAGEGTRQRQRCIDGFVYSAGASQDMVVELDPVNE
jgi:hypothetical protein